MREKFHYLFLLFTKSLNGVFFLNKSYRFNILILLKLLHKSVDNDSTILIQTDILIKIVPSLSTLLCNSLIIL